MTTATVPVVRLQRTINASPERVFDAWLDPQALAVIMRPGEGMAPCEILNDPRVGGRFIYNMMGSKGQAIPHAGEYLEIDRPRKLVFTWISKGTGVQSTTVTIELKPMGAATELTLTHVGLAEKEIAGHTKGWTMIVDQTALYLEK